MRKIKCCVTTDGAGQIVGGLAEGAIACQSDAAGAFKRENTSNASCEAHRESLAAFLGAGFRWVAPAR